MRRFSQLICFVLAFVMILFTTAFAAEAPEPRASMFFTYSSVYFWHDSGDDYQIWFDVTAKSRMNELGASKIVVERSTDLVNWTTVKTFNKSSYTQMTTTATTAGYANYVPYTPADGYAYRAIVTLYARNSSGTGEMDETTALLDLR